MNRIRVDSFLRGAHRNLGLTLLPDLGVMARLWNPVPLAKLGPASTVGSPCGTLGWLNNKEFLILYVDN